MRVVCLVSAEVRCRESETRIGVVAAEDEVEAESDAQVADRGVRAWLWGLSSRERWW